jgi:site-specific recombinase XerD
LRDIAIIQVLAETGIRVGELLALQRGDLVDIQKRSAYLIVRQGKHGNYRTIPLTLAVREALTAYLTQPVQALLAEDDPVWWGPKSPLTQASSILRLLDKYSIYAGIPKVSPHQLRHTFATRYLQRNPGDLRGLATLMGHSDLNTVMLYTEPSLDDLRQRMDLFDQPID